MIHFKKYQNKNASSKSYGKWFGRAVHELMEFDEFIEHMAKHHCVFSEATIRGVLIEMEVCLREMLLEGKAVRFDDLGIFRVGLETTGENTAAAFTADSIKAVRLNLHLGKRFLARNLKADAKFKEVDKYIGDGNYYEPDDGETAGTDEPLPVNPTGGTSGSGTSGGGNSGGEDFFGDMN
jgi:predicted histone-like DNA-binding protein